jgi:hypothetical protein
MIRKLSTFQSPEYLLIFGDTGSVQVQVRFKEANCSICSRKCEPGDLARLINPETGLSHETLYFDDYLHAVDRYVWEPRRKRLTIWASVPPASTSLIEETQK